MGAGQILGGGVLWREGQTLGVVDKADPGEGPCGGQGRSWEGFSGHSPGWVLGVGVVGKGWILGGGVVVENHGRGSVVTEQILGRSCVVTGWTLRWGPVRTE